MTDPLVLLPGLNCTPALFQAQWSAFAAGRALMAAEITRDDTLPAMAARLLAAAPPRFALCGLSMGGYLAFEVMRQAPGRVTRLALLDTSAKPATPETNAMRQELIAKAEAGGFEEVLAGLWLRLVAPSRREDAALKEIVQGMARETGAAAFIRQQRAIMGRIDSRPGLAAIAVPALVLVGAEDVITPPDEAREIAAGIPGAELVTVEGAGHLSTLEAPEAVNAALAAWLARA